MNHLHLLDFPVILEKFTARYMKFYDHEDPGSINNGECFVWAWGVYNFLKRQGIPCSLVTCFSHGGHAWIRVDGIAYDSEHLRGTTCDCLVDDFVGADLDDEELEWCDMEEKEFFDYWYDNGFCYYMLADTSVNSKMNRSISQIGKNHRKVI